MLAGRINNRRRVIHLREEERTREKRREENKEKGGYSWGKKPGSCQRDRRSSESKICRRKIKEKTLRER